MMGPCCTWDCCGPGSFCCANAKPHKHLEDGRVVFDERPPKEPDPVKRDD